jgi:hypothetical protein
MPSTRVQGCLDAFICHLRDVTSADQAMKALVSSDPRSRLFRWSRLLENVESRLLENVESRLPENVESRLPENVESRLPENVESRFPYRLLTKLLFKSPIGRGIHFSTVKYARP